MQALQNRKNREINSAVARPTQKLQLREALALFGRKVGKDADGHFQLGERLNADEAVMPENMGERSPRSAFGESQVGVGDVMTEDENSHGGSEYDDELVENTFEAGLERGFFNPGKENELEITDDGTSMLDADSAIEENGPMRINSEGLGSEPESTSKKRKRAASVHTVDDDADMEPDTFIKKEEYAPTPGFNFKPGEVIVLDDDKNDTSTENDNAHVNQQKLDTPRTYIASEDGVIAISDDNDNDRIITQNNTESTRHDHDFHISAKQESINFPLCVKSKKGRLITIHSIPSISDTVPIDIDPSKYIDAHWRDLPNVITQKEDNFPSDLMFDTDEDDSEPETEDEKEEHEPMPTDDDETFSNASFDGFKDDEEDKTLYNGNDPLHEIEFEGFGEEEKEETPEGDEGYESDPNALFFPETN